jgi:hypothetical protein
MSIFYRRTVRRSEFLFLSLILFLSCTSSVFAKAPLIRNTTAKLPPRTMELEEMWSVGGEDSEFVFGMVIDSLTDDEGNIYLLDTQLCQVEVFDPTGEHLRTISGRGDGPGEIKGPIAMEWMEDGSLALMEIFPGKLVLIDKDGTPRHNVILTAGEDTQTGFISTTSVTCRSGMVLSGGQRGVPREGGLDRVQFLSSFDADGNQITRYCESSIVLSFSNLVFNEAEIQPPYFSANTVGPDKRVYAATNREKYRIEVFHADGTPDRVIERDLKNWPRNGRDRDRMNALVDIWTQGAPGNGERILAKTEPAISEIFVDKEGILWVQHSRSGREQPDGILLSYDTFDAEGNYLQQVSVACDGDAGYDGLKFLGDGRVLLIKGYVLARWASNGATNVDFGEEEHDGPMEIVCCRIR